MLQGRFRVHAVDLIGHGARPAWDGETPCGLADEAAHVAPLLQGGAHVVGHSFGAAVALKLLALHPQRVRSVVAFEPVMFRWLGDDAAVRDVIELAESIRDHLAGADPRSAALRFVDFWSGAGTWDALGNGRQQAVALRMPSVLAHFDALLREPLQAAKLAQVQVPLLFMAGADTVPATARIAQILRLALPRATHEKLPGMGHLGPVTHAEDVNRRIVAFIAEYALEAALA